MSAAKRTDTDEAPPGSAITLGRKVETIISEAWEGKCDLLVVGFVGHSNVFGRVMGSTTQNLSRLSPCSVLIVK